jgi:acyl-coenzyme A synthetase/AMP-(fatty) acid ligase
VRLIETFLAQVDARPEAVAIWTPTGESVTYAQLARGMAARAHGLQRIGVGAGDVVLVARGVSPALYETLLAIFAVGAVAMFPEPAAGLKGVEVAVKAVGPKAVATNLTGRMLKPFLSSVRTLKLGPEGNARIQHDISPAAIPGDAPALITFTSGSTGTPKGIVRSADFLMLQHTLLEKLRQTAPDDIDLISLPVFILSNLAVGATSVIPAGRLTRPAQLDGAALRAQIERHKVNRIVAPPAVLARVLDGAAPLTGLNAVFTGGGPVFPNLMRDMLRLAPNAHCHAVYGSTEAEPISHLSIRDMPQSDWDAMGKGEGLLAGSPIPEIDVRIEDHEIQVAGDHVNRGYLDPAANRETKIVTGGKLWHRTGDAGKIDDTGRIWLLGRRSAAAGGLFPFAVETAALSWPGVKQAALLAGEGRAAKLAVAGDGLDAADLQRRAKAIAEITLCPVDSVPMDKRHNSKVDYEALQKALA